MSHLSTVVYDLLEQGNSGEWTMSKPGSISSLEDLISPPSRSFTLSKNIVNSDTPPSGIAVIRKVILDDGRLFNAIGWLDVYGHLAAIECDIGIAWTRGDGLLHLADADDEAKVS